MVGGTEWETELQTGTGVAWELEGWNRLCILKAEGWPARPAAVKGPRLTAGRLPWHVWHGTVRGEE